MKKTIIMSLALAFVAALLSCNHNASGNAFVTDSCGVVQKFDTTQKVIYLVFTGHYSLNDSGRFENFDGVEPVLNTLKEKGVKGSFFPTAITIEQPKYESSIKRIIAEGHYLSAHSYAHLQLCDDNGKTLVPADSIAADFKKMEAQLNRFGLTKEQYCWMIPPYETYNAETADAMRSLGYKLLNPTSGLGTGMDWTTPGTKIYRSCEQILANLWKYEEDNSMNGVILLIHAMNYPDRTDADRPYMHLGEIIDKLKAKGYTFKTLKDVMALDK